MPCPEDEREPESAMKTSTGWMRFALLGLLMLGMGGGVWAGPPAPDAGAVELETADGLEITARFQPAGRPGAPGAVLLPMYQGSSFDWDAVLKPFADRGVAVLAVDPRGHGRSRHQGPTDLGRKVAMRDPRLFGAMHADVMAAVDWLVGEAGCDPQKIVLVGASVGFAVAVDAAARHPDRIAALIGLSPVEKTLGLDVPAKLKGVATEAPILLLAHRDDVDLGTEQLLAARPGTPCVIYDEARPENVRQARQWAHGTRLLDRFPLVGHTIASFAAKATGSTQETMLLDGNFDVEGRHAEGWEGAVEVGLPTGPGTIRAVRIGRRLLFGGVVPLGAGGLRFEVQTGPESEGSDGELVLGPPQVLAVDLRDGVVAWSWGGMASFPGFAGIDTTKMFGKTQPVLRSVQGEDETCFEGEWYIPEFGDDSEAIRLLIEVTQEVPPRPEGGMVTANPQHAVELISR